MRIKAIAPVPLPGPYECVDCGPIDAGEKATGPKGRNCPHCGRYLKMKIHQSSKNLAARVETKQAVKDIQRGDS